MAIKLHRSLVDASIELCDRVWQQSQVLDSILAERFKASPKWGKRDRHFIANTVFECVRWRQKLAFWLRAKQRRRSVPRIGCCRATANLAGGRNSMIPGPKRS